MKPFVINAKTISDAWFQTIYNIFDNSYRQDIQKGSFEKEQYRLQYPGLVISIEYPDQDMVPVIPFGMLDDKGNAITSPTSEEFNTNYFANYIMNKELAENETYKYASRIHEDMPGLNLENQLETVIDILKVTPLTNQAVIEIAKPSDIATCIGNDGKLDPPCLRLIDFKVIPQTYCSGVPALAKLTATVYFRSWDLWAGLPVNLAGIEYLKQYVAGLTGLKNGPIYAYSAGAHIYGYQEKFARVRAMKAAKVGMED